MSEIPFNPENQSESARKTFGRIRFGKYETESARNTEFERISFGSCTSSDSSRGVPRASFKRLRRAGASDSGSSLDMVDPESPIDLGVQVENKKTISSGVVVAGAASLLRSKVAKGGMADSSTFEDPLLIELLTSSTRAIPVQEWTSRTSTEQGGSASSSS
mmetsp:Transcript_13062/g.22924  ORF Transcript_13062/g.22924 Transcript_13062/m.22924 type:complete len:161 (+) Transcript_13062:168-650(+)